MPALINDGHTLKIVIPGEGRPELEGYEAVTLRYRPATYAEAKEWTDAIDQQDKTAKFIKDHLVDWSLGAPLDLNNVKHLNPNLAGKLLLIILGRDKEFSLDVEADAKNSDAG